MPEAFTLTVGYLSLELFSENEKRISLPLGSVMTE